MTPEQAKLYETITRALMSVLGAWNKYVQEEKDKDKDRDKEQQK